MVKPVYISLLRQERERRGWSRNYIAEQIGVDVVTVGRWERGERLPHPVYRQLLCSLFEMNALDLGLLSEPSQESNEEGAIADVPSGIQDTKPAAPSEHTLVEKKKLLSASRNVFRERRALLIGIGGFGIATLTGSGLLLASRTSSLTPSVSKHANISIDKPFQLLFDPNKFNGINRLSWSLDESYIAAATRTNIVSSGIEQRASFLLPSDSQPVGQRCCLVEDRLDRLVQRRSSCWFCGDLEPQGKQAYCNVSASSCDSSRPGHLMETTWRSPGTAQLLRSGTPLSRARLVSTSILRWVPSMGSAVSDGLPKGIWLAQPTMALFMYAKRSQVRRRSSIVIIRAE